MIASVRWHLVMAWFWLTRPRFMVKVRRVYGPFYQQRRLYNTAPPLPSVSRATSGTIEP